MNKKRMRIIFISIIVTAFFLLSVYLWNYKKVTTDVNIKEVNAVRLDIKPDYENLKDLQFDSKGHLCAIYLDNSSSQTLVKKYDLEENQIEDLAILSYDNTGISPFAGYDNFKLFNESILTMVCLKESNYECYLIVLPLDSAVAQTIDLTSAMQLYGTWENINIIDYTMLEDGFFEALVAADSDIRHYFLVNIDINKSIITSVQLLNGSNFTHAVMEDEVLSYIDNSSDISVFHVINLITKETLEMVPIGELDYNDDVIYSNEQIFKVDSRCVALYDEEYNTFNSIFSKLQEESRYPDYIGADSECYIKNRVMMNKDGKVFVIRAIMEYGDCKECIVQKLLLE